MFPRLTKWDEEARRLVRGGSLAREDYQKLRKENQIDVLDEETEERKKVEAARAARATNAMLNLKNLTMGN